MARGFRLALPPIRGAGAQLAIGFLIVSVAVVLSKRFLMPLLALVPQLVLEKYYAWQVVTYSFIENSPTGIIFGALILWSIGGALEMDWGRRRFFTFAIVTPSVAGILMVGLSLLLPVVQEGIFFGGTAMTSSLWVAYGLRIGSRQTNFWGLPVSGNILALIGVGFVFLDGAFNGWLRALPSVFALLITFAYVQWRFPTAVFERIGSWRLRRRLAKRTRQLRVVSDGQRNTSGGSDKFLH